MQKMLIVRGREFVEKKHYMRSYRISFPIAVIIMDLSLFVVVVVNLVHRRWISSAKSSTSLISSTRSPDLLSDSNLLCEVAAGSLAIATRSPLRSPIRSLISSLSLYRERGAERENIGYLLGLWTWAGLLSWAFGLGFI